MARTAVVLATRNAHKLEELQRILVETGLDVELIGLDAFPDLDDVVEDGETFAANALLKARAAAAATSLPAVADDSGLCVDALGGMPGVRSARWAGVHGDDAANVELLLRQIADVPDGRRGARFVCAAVVATPRGAERVEEGQLDGSVVWEPRGTNGFGYDPIFLPAGERRTTAEMPAAEKDAISHRGRALRALAPLVGELLYGGG
jgi:XTP/dITP diphosphohydrolase